jgi:hypothetical protein
VCAHQASQHAHSGMEAVCFFLLEFQRPFFSCEWMPGVVFLFVSHQTALKSNSIQSDTKKYKQIQTDKYRYKQINTDKSRKRQIQTNKHIQTDKHGYIQIYTDTVRHTRKTADPEGSSPSCRPSSSLWPLILPSPAPTRSP